MMAFPGRYRKRLRTTNGVERLRERVIRIFPKRLALRLIGAALMLVYGASLLRYD
ncbi:MAG: hypothetical protein AB1497_09105 [Bacillota bacterium]